ncbi:MAG: tryptophan--tRNA ligase [Clostridium sp.]|nr:tryptophan--tRNA ligase [Clostridium sp.]MCM1443893.1 tryptophan--tRNA ligase [Candidatus Amulumruptor caecigallinarius]
MERKRMLTGIRPTGNLHIGHYFGTVKNWVELQNDNEMFIEIADVQALTDNFDNPEKIRKNVKEIALDLLSIGIDPDKTTLFLQSRIPEIAELTVFFSNLVTMSRLYRNPTVKTEIAQKKEVFGNYGESVTYGFVGYPVSQTADIVAFGGEIIPVGDDQQPLIEQAREIIRKFNSIYNSNLKEPEALLNKTSRIKGIDGNVKMGKSLGNAIYLVDSEEEISRKIMSAVTDPKKIKANDPANPDICMVYYYHNLVNKENLNTVCSECKNGKRGCVNCKKELIQKMNEFLYPIRIKRKYYEEHIDKVNDILLEGSNIAKQNAEKIVFDIKKDMKINYFE